MKSGLGPWKIFIASDNRQVMPTVRSGDVAVLDRHGLAISYPIVAAATIIAAIAGSAKSDPGGPRPRPQSWADCELFDGVVTPTSLPVRGNFDQLYTGGSGFKDGVPLISESKPGDQDYNGGRWHLNVLKAGVPAGKYADACRVEDLRARFWVAADF